ncbi:MAG: gamma-glutamylcyclotransferase family protein [Kiritimatiellia bacterium]
MKRPEYFNLFAYGSLMCPQIMCAVTGIAPKGEAAVLSGYRRQPVQHELYPGLQPSPADHVHGTLYRVIPVRFMEMLDRFEGSEYERITVDVMTTSGLCVRAVVYCTSPPYRYRLRDDTWDFEAFMRSTWRQLFDQ